MSSLKHRLLAAGIAVTSVAAVAAGSTPTAGATPAGTRAQIPWSQVGPGWRLATWAPKANARTTLFVVSPTGRRWTVAHLNPYAAARWSPDGRRALISGLRGFAEIDLHTGRGHAVRLPANAFVDSYSRPRGLALLVDVQVAQGDHLVDRLVRTDERGRRQLTYPSSLPGAGQLATSGVRETADGTQLVLGAAHGLVVLRNDGRLVRRLLPHAGRCQAPSWWSANVVLAECGGVLRATPISGAPPRAVSRGANKENPFGYADEWRYSRGRLGLSYNGCGPASLVRFDRAGNGKRFEIHLPNGHRTHVSYVGRHGDVIDVMATRDPGCVDSARTLLAYDAVTHHSRALLGPGVNGGTVVGAAEYADR